MHHMKLDLMVFLLVTRRPAGAHIAANCTSRTHEGEPLLELVVETMSVSSVARDYGVKTRLYAVMGVAEY